MVDGEHCVAIVKIDAVFCPIPVAEHIHVVNGEIVLSAVTVALALC